MFHFSYSRWGERSYFRDVLRKEPDMRSISLVLTALCVTCGAIAGSQATAATDDVIQLERAALDRWGNGDPAGFLETYAPEITYFDVGTEKRLDGHETMAEYYRPIVGKIKVSSYEMIGPKVQRHGDVAVLTYNLRSEGVQPDGKALTVRWNSTSVYARMSGRWKMIHSHWSLTAPPCLRGTV
jgi:ketosteroid isomerase-like protein